MARSKWKSFYFTKSIWRAIYDKKSSLKKKKSIKISFSRSSSIPSSFISDNIVIHKGNMFKRLFLTKFLIGYKFGEFSFSRKPFTYPMKLKKKTKR